MYKLFLLALVSYLSVCGFNNNQHTSEFNNDQPQTKKDLSFPGTDRIIVTFAPEADFTAANVCQEEIVKSEIIEQWMKELSKIPNEGSGKMVKFRANTPEYRIEFFNDSRSLGILRIKGGLLDAPSGEGWDFYDNEDTTFVNLVQAYCKEK